MALSINPLPLLLTTWLVSNFFPGHNILCSKSRGELLFSSRYFDNGGAISRFRREMGKIKRGYIEAIAFFLEMYPGHEIYFLARDGEPLYDQARIVLQNSPKGLARIHLLNISRSNMREVNATEYLAQEGISDETLAQGKKILLVDTGTFGSVPFIISSYFPENHQSQIESHFLLSLSQEVPSTRTFLRWLKPNLRFREYPAGSLQKLQKLIESYELSVPHYTNTSDHFAMIGNRWHPMSPSHSLIPNDGIVSREKAIQHMQDSLYFNQTEKAKELYEKQVPDMA